MKEQEFVEEVEKLGIHLTQNQLQKFEEFYQILIQENEKMNLTRITQKEEVYLKHFYDSLTLVKVLNPSQIKTVCDVGSGAGFPGIVLKIAFPDWQITLLDAREKRVNYLKNTIQQLNLQGITAIHTRAEDYAKKEREKFDIVTARAVANLKVLEELCIPMVKIHGYFIAMKSNVEEELKESKSMLKELKSKIVEIKEFYLPMENSKRSLIKIEKQEITPIKYPRSIEKIKK